MHEKVEEDKKSCSDSGEDDFLNRSVCSVNNEDLDNDINYSDEEDERAKVMKAIPKRKL